MPPREILTRGKTVVHSVKFSVSDLSIRTLFARSRRRALEGGDRRIHEVTRTLELTQRTARLRAWLRWRYVGARALREDRPRQARRIFRRCVTIAPENLEAWLGLAGSLLPGWVLRPLRVMRSYGTRALHRLGRR
jgi:hypothetical protein